MKPPSKFLRLNLVSFLLLALASYYIHNGWQFCNTIGNFNSTNKRGEKDASLTRLRELGFLIRYWLGERDERVFEPQRGSFENIHLRKELYFQHPANAIKVSENLAPSITNLVARLKEAGIESIVLPVPMKSSVYHETIPKGTFETSVYQRNLANIEGFNVESNPLYQKLSQSTPQIVNLYEHFRTIKTQIPTTSLYIPYDFHWSAFGAAQSIVALVEQLKALHYSVQSAHIQALSQSQHPIVQTYLLNTFQLPSYYLKSRSDLKWHETYFKVHPVTKSPLFPRIVLIGSSMCNYLEGTGFDFHTMLQQTLSQSIEKYCIDGAAVEMGWKNAVEKGLELNKGDLVVWEFYTGEIPQDGKVNLTLPKIKASPH